MSFSMALRRLAAATTRSSCNKNHGGVFVRSFASYNAPPPSGGQYYQVQPTASGTNYFGGQQQGGGGPLRGYPAYSVVDDKCILTFKLIPPTFKVLGNGTVVLDGSKKGRIMLEFAPRSPEGVVGRNKDEVFRFALSAEEVGFLLHQLPTDPVTFARRPPKDEMAEADFRAATGKEPMKVCRITPEEGGKWKFLVDFEIDNVGGQALPNSPVGPMSAMIQLGEVEVIRRIMGESMSYLAGWKTLCDIQDDAIRAILEQNGPPTRY